MEKAVIGIIGCGNIFTMHATSCAHLKNATLVGVCDVKKDRADKAAQKYGVQAYYDYKDLIDKKKIDLKDTKLLWKGSSNQRVIDVQATLKQEDKKIPVLHCGDYS